MDQTRLKVGILNITQGLVDRGAETFVAELAKLLQRDCQVEVMSSRRPLAKRWPLLWRTYLDPQGWQVLLFSLRQIGRIWRQRFDVVVAVNGGWQSVVVRLVTWAYGGKMVISGQSGKGWDDRINLWTCPDSFVALSSFLRGWAKKVNPRVRVDYIPNGVDLEKFRPEGAKIELPLPRPIVLVAGALTEEKRIELIIKALVELPGVSLLVVGDGPKRAELKELGEKLLGERFMISKYSFEQMPAVYRAVDLFTLPSPWFRSFEIVIVEAMATNLPVVVNNDPIRKEIVGAAGVLVEPTDAKAYAEAISQALETKWGDRPLKQAASFAWQTIAENYLKLFRSLAR